MTKKNHPLLLIVSSPSGAGKTTLCHRLLDEFSDLRFSVSHTTRPPRKGEVDGRDYHFVGEAEFDRMVDDELFIEWAEVHGNRYGTAHAEIRAASMEGMDLVFDVDYHGARKIKDEYPEAVGVFVLPPSIEELRRRLHQRGTETSESIERRFQASVEEIRRYEVFDYIVTNEVVEVAYRDGLRAILLAERQRRQRRSSSAEALLED
ncbi:MAG: guanylate kinase [Polyangia bacterium]